jgi:septal ring factor EnvC (AmiA/AmiB activator)
VLTAKVKEALQKAMALKTKVSTTQQELAQVNKELKVITDDQTRLRANLKETPPTAPVYKRYLEKLEKQETEIDKLQASQKTLQDAELAQKKEFETYLAGLDVE